MIIEYCDTLYPKQLREIKNPPSRLYVLGNIKILQDIGIAVVGSRTHSQYGEKMCKTFTKSLVEYNINVISGLAKGIDAIAHKTCLEYSGKTIAVLPSGLDNIFPKENVELAKQIIDKGGALVSEYEPKTEADSKKFLERNRIVAGLGIGTLVIEAGYRSGTRVTAKITKEQNKPVFCLPSSLENSKGVSSNELIQKGANLVTKVKNILDFYPNITFSKKSLEKEKMNRNPVSKELGKIYGVISDTPINANEIAKKTGLSISEVNYKLLILQLDEKIMELPGQKFIRKE